MRSMSFHLDGTDGRPPSAYYENNGSGNYTIPSNAGFINNIKASYGNAIGDIQNDGLPDIAVVNIDDQPIDLWVNQTATQNNWLKVKLQGTQSNRMGIGSYIEYSRIRSLCRNADKVYQLLGKWTFYDGAGYFICFRSYPEFSSFSACCRSII